MKRRVLVADNKYDEVEDLIEALEDREGYEVVYAEDGREALQRLREGGLDAVILDLDMLPEGCSYSSLEEFYELKRLYGNEVAKEARRLRPGMPIVLRSSVAAAYKKELGPYGVYCHTKGELGDEPIIDYLRQQFSKTKEVKD